jgi:hypothetical protein
VRKLLIIITSISVVAGTGIAWAATTITSKVTPKTPGKGSTLQVRTGAFPPTNTLPTSMTIDVQKGFATGTNKRGTADSTHELCTAAQETSNQCPVDSSIGQGNASVTFNPELPGATGAVPVSIELFLGRPRHNNCPATVLFVLAVQSTTTDAALAALAPAESAVGDLCKKNGGLEINFPNLPTFSTLLQQIAPNETITVNTLYLSAAASTVITTKTKKKVTVVKNGKKTTVTKTITKRVRHHLINNPPKCPASKKWKGTFTIRFNATGYTLPLTFACKKK